MKSLIIIFAILLFPLQFAYSEESEPIEILKLFEETYGTADMDTAASLTTSHFRDNRPKAVWVYDTWKALNQIEYKRIKSSVVESRIKDEKTLIILQTTISTIGGKAEQKELYGLLKQNGTWLIDELVVGDEQLINERMKL